MSMSFYCYRETANGVEFAPEDVCPNFSNSNAAMILRSLDVEPDHCVSIDADDLLARVTLARAVPPIEDDGKADITTGGPGTGQALMIDCGVRPGYFESAYERIAEVAELAREWGVKVVVA